MQRKLFVPRAREVLLERPGEWEKKRESGEGEFFGAQAGFWSLSPSFFKKANMNIY